MRSKDTYIKRRYERLCAVLLEDHSTKLGAVDDERQNIVLVASFRNARTFEDASRKWFAVNFADENAKQNVREIGG